PKTLLVFGREPGTLRNIEASGGVGFLHDMLETAGGDDVLADTKQQSVTMSTELVLARAPDVIVELRYARGDASAASDLRAWVACVDPKALDAVFAGREFDAALLADLPASVDPCGERGEFHTCAYAGPMFSRPIAVERGITVERDGFVFADLTLAGEAVR